MQLRIAVGLGSDSALLHSATSGHLADTVADTYGFGFLDTDQQTTCRPNELEVAW